MSRRKKLINNTDIPQHEIEAIARCIWPDILLSMRARRGKGNLRSGRPVGRAKGKRRT